MKTEVLPKENIWTTGPKYLQTNSQNLSYNIHAEYTPHTWLFSGTQYYISDLCKATYGVSHMVYPVRKGNIELPYTSQWPYGVTWSGAVAESQDKSAFKRDNKKGRCTMQQEPLEASMTQQTRYPLWRQHGSRPILHLGAERCSTICPLAYSMRHQFMIFHFFMRIETMIGESHSSIYIQ
jgi:hypothetical protein